MTDPAVRFARLIFLRPRREFPLPPEWLERICIPLGELRPLLQAVSPVRDLADLWRWAALPLPALVVQAALAPFEDVEVRWGETHSHYTGHAERSDARALPTLLAQLVPAASEGEVERIELRQARETLLAVPSNEVAERLLEVAAALRSACGGIAVGL